MLGIIADRLHPTSWSESLATILEERFAVVEALFARQPDHARDDWYRERRAWIAERCARERDRDLRTDERFE